MCERMGDKPDPAKMPPEFSDLPDTIQTGVIIYRSLPDTYTGGQVNTYSGKNLAALPLLLELHCITDNNSKLEVTETILFLDEANIKESVDRAKRELQKGQK